MTLELSGVGAGSNAGYDNMTTIALPAECQVTAGGVLSFVLLLALPLAMLLTWVTVSLYRYRVAEVMRQVSAAAPAGEKSVAAQPSGTPVSSTLEFRITDAAAAAAPVALQGLAAQRVKQSLRAYMIAGLAQALIVTLLTFLLAGIELLPLRFLATLSLYLWPLVPTLMLISLNDQRHKWLWLVGYFALLLTQDLALSGLGLRDDPQSGSLLLVWAIWLGPPSVLLWLLSNRAWRSVGLLAYLVSSALVAAWLLSTQGLGCLALALNDVSLWSDYHWPLLAFNLVAVGGVVWWLLTRLARRYRDKHWSDLSLTLASWWLLITLIEVAIQFDATQGASLLFFVGWLVFLWLSRRLQRMPGDTPPVSLLLLRVFGYRQRSRQLLDQLGQRWRYIGPISLIGAPDLAATNLEPDELIQFWGLRMRQQFVADRAMLQQRLQDFDARPDPDGRYRINEFFCYDNTWRDSVRALAQRSDAVLMDLRGFGPGNRGCEFELGLLLAEVPLRKVLLLVDRSTDSDNLKALLQQLWRTLPADSPNRLLSQPVLNLFRVAGALHSAQSLLHQLTAAAAPAGTPHHHSA